MANNNASLDNEDELKQNETPSSIPGDALEDDGTPVLDEMDLEENNLSVEDADKIIWDEPKEGGEQGSSSGPEEKDITD